MILLCLCATLTSTFSRYQVLVRGQSLPSGACVMCQVRGQPECYVASAASCSELCSKCQFRSRERSLVSCERRAVCSVM